MFFLITDLVTSFFKISICNLQGYHLYSNTLRDLLFYYDQQDDFDDLNIKNIQIKIILMKKLTIYWSVVTKNTTCFYVNDSTLYGLFNNAV